MVGKGAILLDEKVRGAADGEVVCRALLSIWPEYVGGVWVTKRPPVLSLNTSLLLRDLAPVLFSRAHFHPFMFLVRLTALVAHVLRHAEVFESSHLNVGWANGRVLLLRKLNRIRLHS
jgi:hypothetical protein